MLLTRDTSLLPSVMLYGAQRHDGSVRNIEQGSHARRHFSDHHIAPRRHFSDHHLAPHACCATSVTAEHSLVRGFGITLQQNNGGF